MKNNTRRTTHEIVPGAIGVLPTRGLAVPARIVQSGEVDFLAREAVGIYDADRPEVWREKSGAPRTAFAAHLYNEAFGILGAHRA